MNLKLKNVSHYSSSLIKARLVAVFLVFAFTQNVMSQAISVDEAATNQEVKDFVEDVLLGSCVTVSNISYTGPPDASGTFDGAGTILGLDGGIILTTGQGGIAEGPDDDNYAGNNQNNGGDPDLNTLAGLSTFDAVILEFDFVPQNADLRFNYIFGSEEYPEYVNAGFNDVFGFFISGPGITGPFTSPAGFPGGSQNIALIPGTSTPVGIDNVNNGQSGSEPATGPCTNCAYYVDNSGGAALQYDGYTTVLTAEATVTPCLTYHIKLAVGDAGDGALDSGVFLEEESFSAGGGVTVDIQTSTAPTGIYEGCNDAWFIFRRVDLSDNLIPLTVGFTITGTATPVADYAAFSNTITIPAGEDSVFINLGVVLDFIPEGSETIIVTMDDPACTCLAPASAEVIILDNDIPLAVATTGTTTICLGQSTDITANSTGSQTPYISGWDNGLPAGDNQIVTPTTTTTYTYTVSDNCGGQTVSSSETVTVIRPDFTIDDDEQCFDGNSFSFSNTAASGGTVTHFWDFGDSNTSTSENPTHSYASDGSYTVTHNVIYTASSCTSDASAMITVFDEPILTVAVDQDVICDGGTDGVISTSITGGTAAFNYAWTPGGATASGISGLSVGAYSVVVTDANGCTDNGSGTIVQNDPISPTVVCQNIIVQLNASGVVTMSASQVDNGSSDNCGIASMVVSPNAFDCSEIGANAVTLTVTDVNGNVSTCNAIVTVEDIIAPVAVCQSFTVQLDASGNASIVAADVDGGSTDNCTVSVTATPLVFTCANVGANTVVLTAIDASGNTDNCNATVTVEDDFNPAALCQDFTVQLDASGNATISATDVNNGSTDACGIASLVVNPNAFTCANIGPNSVTLTVTDVNGNVSTCNATVTVEHIINPTAVCQDITVQLDASGALTIISADIDGGSADNCGAVTLTIDGGVSSLNFDCTDVGTQTITLTVTDVNGNVSVCTADVTIEDSIDPTALCQDIIVQLDALGNATITGPSIDNGSSDNCGIASLIAGPNSFDCSSIGVNTVTLTVTDDNGNLTTCTADVTIEDNVNPNAVCQDITVQLDANGDATIVAADVDGGSSDNCAIDFMTVNPNVFDCNNLGTNLVQLNVTDVNGNVSTCTSTVTVGDNVPPTPMCQDIIAELDPTGNVIVAPGDVDNGSFDNCAIVSITLDPNTFVCADIGLNAVTLTVTDVAGNVSTCPANVDVQDNVLPSALCQDITVQIDAAGNALITPTMLNNGSTDACGVTPTIVSLANFNCSNVGVNIVTLTVEDANGNTSTCESTVIIEDNINPDAVCQDVTVELNATGNVTIVPADVDGGSSDNCDIDFMTVDPNSFTCAEEGANTVTLTVTDVNGNVSTCTAVVTVENTVIPSVSCQDITIFLDAAGNASIVAVDVDGGSNAACGIASLTVDPSTFNCSNVGPNTVTLTATDNTGNVTTCTSTVTVLDTISPTAVCQDVTVQLDATGDLTITSADIDGGSADNCDVASVTIDQGQLELDFDCSSVGINTVTLTVTDVNGNVSACDVEITVEDNVNPAALCQDITVQLDANGEVIITSADVDGGSNDNCTVASLDINPNTFDCTNFGTNSVLLTVTDNNGNVSTCIATITVSDTIPPTAVCTDITVQLEADGTATIVAGDVDNGSFDNCAIQSLNIDIDAFDCSNVGPNTVTLTVTDVNGNVSTCTSTATVEDNVDPLLTCQNITIQLAANGQVSITALDVDNGSTDACGIDNMSVDVTDFDCANVGVNQVTLTVTDVNGNFNICQAVVTVLDTVPPTAVCQDITIQLDSTGSATIVAADVDGVSTDNCAIDAIAIDQNTFDCTQVGDNIVTLTVVDVNGNSDICSAEITVLDTLNPVIIACPTDTVIVPDSSNCSPQVFWTEPTTEDNCSATLTSDFISGDNFSLGTTTVTYASTDQSGNSVSCSFNIEIEPTPVLVSITPQQRPCGYNLSCNAAADGEATANPAGGCLSYTYLWSDLLAQTTQTATGLIAGTYAVTVIDANGTTATETIVVTEPDVLATDSIASPEFNGGVNISCNGEFDGAANINVIGGSECVTYDFAWTGPNGFTSTNEDLTGLEAGTYVVTVSDASGCSYMDSITLIEPALLDVGSLISDYNGVNISCGGAADGSIDLTVSGGANPYTYVWNNGETTEGIDGLVAGIYTYTVTDANGCQTSGSFTLTEPDGLSSFNTTSDYNAFNISCFGLPDGSIDLSVNDGTAPYTYVWSNGEVTQDIDTLSAGPYTVVITDANGCILQDSVMITEPDDIVINPTDTTIISCNPAEDGAFTVEAVGGVPTFTYAWSDGQTGPIAQDLSLGSYIVTATDINGCQDSILLLLTEPFEPEAFVVQIQDVVCNGETNGIVDVSVIGGTSPFTYNWSNSSTDPDLNGVAAGTYDLEVTDAQGCIDTISAVVGEPDLLIMIVDTVIDATCSGTANGEITVEGFGGTAPYTYFWPDLNESGPTVTGLEAGVYIVQVTDDNGCAWSLNVVVGQPSSIDATVSVVTEVSCNGFDDAEALVFASVGTTPYTYLWSNSDVDSLAEGLSAGTYSVTVSDAAGCDTTLSIVVTEPTLIDITVDTIYNVTCNGLVNGQAEVDVAGGTIPHTVSWSNGDDGYVANNLEAGIHTAYVTDGNGCNDSLQAVITEPDTIQLLQALTTNTTCFAGNDGDATVIVAGGTEPYTYNWPFIGQTGNTATDLSAGEYVFVVSDASSCVYTDTVQITAPEEIVVTVTSDTVVCPGNGVAISASATGGAGNYSYSWDNSLGLRSTHFVSPPVATTYNVQITDQSGCPASIASVTIDIAQLPVADFTSAADVPCVLPTTIIYTNTSTGATGFEWLLGNGDLSSDENPTATYDVSGSYTVTLIATSSAGCSDTTTQGVNIDDVPTADFTIDNAQGCAPLSVNFGNGSGTGLEYMWDFGDGTTSSAPNPTHWYEIPGDYEVTLVVSSIGGCSDTLGLGAAVLVYSSPIAAFTLQQIIFPEPGSEYEFINNTTGADLYNWGFGNGEQTDEYQPTYQYPTYGGYFVTLTAINEFGCADTAVHYLNVDLNAHLFVPNAIGIGQPGEVGVFLPKGTGIEDYHIWIFDKWGSLIWESTTVINGIPAEGWYGVYKGQTVPQGSYIWKIDATFIDGEIWEGQEHSNSSTSNTGSIMVLY